MKKLLLTFTYVLIYTVSFSQVNNFTLPWNPNVDNDPLVGTSDLMGLLSVYNTVFASEAILVNADSTHLLLYAGYLNYFECLGYCENLNVSSRVMNEKDFAIHSVEIVNQILSQPGYEKIWIEPIYNSQYKFEESGPSGQKMAIHFSNIYTQNYAYGLLMSSMTSLNRCYCASEQLRKVEYTYCEGSLYDCADSLTQEGWYPVSGITIYNGNKYQAFWRWAN